MVDHTYDAHTVSSSLLRFPCVLFPHVTTLSASNPLNAPWEGDEQGSKGVSYAEDFNQAVLSKDFSLASSGSSVPTFLFLILISLSLSLSLSCPRLEEPRREEELENKETRGRRYFKHSGFLGWKHVSIHYCCANIRSINTWCSLKDSS